MSATFLDIVHGYGLLSARPAAGIPGSLYFATDTSLLYRDNGTTWDTIALGGSGGSVPAGGSTGQVLNKASGTDGDTAWHTLAKADVGLSNVDNTSDATKNAAIATLTNKTLTSPVITTPTGIDASDISGFNTAVRTNRLDQMATPSADVALGGYKITGVADPVSAQDAATKTYVDALSQGLSWKAAVRVATTANGTLATAYENGDTVDGVVLVTGDRILLKDQTAGTENGIYTVNASGAPTRSTDANTGAELLQASCFVEEGTANADTLWVNSTNGPITIGVTSLVFVQLSGGGASYSAGSGLALGGTVFSVDIPSLTADATPDGAADYVMTYDDSATANKKVLLNNLPGGGGGMTNPMTTAGDIILGDTGGSPIRLPKGTTGQVLTIDPSTILPVWAVVRGYANPFDVPPASPSAYDDEFDAASLDAKWTNPAITTRTNTISLDGSWLYLEPSEAGTGSTGKRANAIRQNSPSGSFTITAKFADNAPSNDDGRLGFFTGRTASNKGIIWGPYKANGSQAAFCTFTYSETTDFGAYDGDANSTYATYTGAGYYRMIWDAGASTMVYQYSVDGVFWITALTRTSQAQPDRMGIALWSNSSTLLADHTIGCDFFRIT